MSKREDPYIEARYFAARLLRGSIGALEIPEVNRSLLMSQLNLVMQDLDELYLENERLRRENYLLESTLENERSKEDIA